MTNNIRDSISTAEKILGNEKIFRAEEVAQVWNRKIPSIIPFRYSQKTLEAYKETYAKEGHIANWMLVYFTGRSLLEQQDSLKCPSLSEQMILKMTLKKLLLIPGLHKCTISHIKKNNQ